MRFEIRRGSLDRLKDAQRLNEAVFREFWNPPYSLRDYLLKLRQENSLLLLAVQGQEVVGDLIAFHKQNSFYIWLLAVEEEFRRNGIGNALIKECEDFSLRTGQSKVTSKVYNGSRQMQRLLIKRGYFITDLKKGTKDIRYNALSFELTLDESPLRGRQDI